MAKAIWMSDLHFVGEGDVLGHDPRVRLTAAIDHINAYHRDAGFCIISGDMVNRGTVGDYRALGVLLKRLDVPCLPMVGNHDDRALLRAQLGVPEGCMDDFVQYTVPTDAGLFICLDTQKAGADGGAFCAVRRAWLSKVLAGAGETPAYLFMHHPPRELGLPMQDTDRMEEGEDFLEFLGQFSNVKYLFIGHVHRPISGTMAGIPFSTMRSVLYQAPAPRPDWDWDTFQPGEEAPNIGAIRVAGGDVTLQYLQVCPHGVGQKRPASRT